MGMDVGTLRKLVSLDESDPLSRFALGKKLFETSDGQSQLEEAAGHLRFANERSPQHLATYHILGQALLKLGLTEEAKQVLTAGVQRVAAPAKEWAATSGLRCRRSF